ncbi:MAG: MFS transporter [Acidimicrobiaceae bacterium]|nr:MFS transporter [Acidimicrobiaceae bacterium]
MNGPWSPLRIRIFRALWIAGLVSNIGTFMHIVAASWTMTTLSDSPTLVGLVQTAWALPGFLLALYAGAFADIIDRRQLIAITQLFALVVAGALAILQWTDNLSIELLLVGTFLESVALTIAAPAFMALTPELVGTDRLAQAIGLDSVSRNIAQSIGPAFAGAIIAATNPGAVFALNAISFIGIVIVVQKNKSGRSKVMRPDAINQVIREGLQYVIRSRQLRNVVIRLAIALAATSALTSVLPVVARKSLQVSASGFGLLSGALGVGSVVAVWGLPRIRSKLRLEIIVLLSAAVWSGGTALLAATSNMWVALLALLICGASMMAMLNTLFSTFTLQLPNLLRGRGTSLAMLMVWLGVAIGTFAWGAVASVFGVGNALLIAAVVNIFVALFNRVVLPLGEIEPA